MRFVKLLAAIAVSLVLLASVMVGLVGYDLTRTVLEPMFYEQVFDEQGVYGVMLETVLVSVDRTLAEAPAFFKEGVQAGLRESLTEDWVRDQVGAILGGLFAYLKGETSDLVMLVSLREFKEPVARAVPSGLSGQDAKQAGMLMSELERMPEQYNVAEMFKGARLSEARPYVGYLVKTPGYALGVATLTAVLLWLLAGRRAAAARWVGIPLFLAGVMGIAMSLVGTTLGMAGLSGSNLQVVPQEVLPIDMTALASSLIRQMTSVLLSAASVVAAVSLVLMITPAFLRPRTPVQVESSPVETSSIG